MTIYTKKFSDGTYLQVSTDTRQDALTITITPLDASDRQIDRAQDIGSEMKEMWKKIVPAVQETTKSKPNTSVRVGMPEDYPVGATFRSKDAVEAEREAGAVIEAFGLEKADEKKMAVEALRIQLGTLLDRNSLSHEEKTAVLGELLAKLTSTPSRQVA